MCFECWSDIGMKSMSLKGRVHTECGAEQPDARGYARRVNGPLRGRYVVPDIGMHVCRTGFLSDSQRRIWLSSLMWLRVVGAKYDKVAEMRRRMTMENIVHDRSKFCTRKSLITIRLTILTCAQKLTSSQLNLISL